MANSHAGRQGNRVNSGPGAGGGYQNPFGPGAAGAGHGMPGGYTGLGGIMELLQNGISAQQYANMAAGFNGADGGAVGGADGRFQGLSPYAMHYLTTSGLLDKIAAPKVALTDANGAPLTGDALFMANLQNSMAQYRPATYQLHSGVTQSDLANLFANGLVSGDWSGVKGAYAKGYNSTGKIKQGGSFGPPTAPPAGASGPGNGFGTG